MSETEFLEYIEALCKRPKIYTPTGTFVEIVSFLEGYGAGANVGTFESHSVFTPFREWVFGKFDLQGETKDWSTILKVFSSDEEALKKLPALYREYIETI